MLHDPRAVDLVERIDYPFAERFGTGPGLGQCQALRARCFDVQVGRFLRRHPDGTVVALDEGLETQLWRVDNGRVRWVSVDLPETIQVHRRLLPESDWQRTVAASALDARWMDAVDPAQGVLVTAQGLFMYLALADVHGLIPPRAVVLRQLARLRRRPAVARRAQPPRAGSCSPSTAPTWPE